MYIIIVGGGKVGYYLARTLINEGHEVLVIELDPRKSERIADELGTVVLRGDGCEASTLAEAGASRADMLIAVTGDDEDNLVACQVAKVRFKVPRTIARINNPKNERIFKRLGIDVTVSATNIILEHIGHEVPTHRLTRLLELRDLGLEIVEVRIPPTSPVVGKRVAELSLPTPSVLAAIISRGRGAQIPNAETVIQANDEVLAVVSPEVEAEFRRALTGA
ncbi:MAG: portal protein [Chloroflexota bacterium]|mgnify:FL=1